MSFKLIAITIIFGGLFTLSIWAPASANNQPGASPVTESMNLTLNERMGNSQVDQIKSLKSESVQLSGGSAILRRSLHKRDPNRSNLDESGRESERNLQNDRKTQTVSSPKDTQDSRRQPHRRRFGKHRWSYRSSHFY